MANGNLNDHRVVSIQRARKESSISAARTRTQMKDNLRMEVEARAHIKQMEKAAFALYLGYEEDPFEPGLEKPIGRERAAVLKAAADISEKLLRKVLPDLKQVEVHSTKEQDDDAILADVEIANRLRLYIDSKAKRGELVMAAIADDDDDDDDCTIDELLE